MNKADITEQILYSVISILLANILFRFISTKFLWIYIVVIVLMSAPIKNIFQQKYYRKLVSRS